MMFDSLLIHRLKKITPVERPTLTSRDRAVAQLNAEPPVESVPDMPVHGLGELNLLYAARGVQSKIDSISAELETIERRKNYLIIEKAAYTELRDIGEKYAPQLDNFRLVITRH